MTHRAHVAVISDSRTTTLTVTMATAEWERVYESGSRDVRDALLQADDDATARRLPFGFTGGAR